MVYWKTIGCLGGRQEFGGQAPPELMKDQIVKAKKVEL